MQLWRVCIISILYNILSPVVERKAKKGHKAFKHSVGSVGAAAD